MAIDTVGQRLFVAALGNNTVEVLDVKEGLHLKSLPGFREPQGIAFLPDLKLAVVANGQGDGVQIIDADNYRVATSVRLGDDSDNVRYEAGAKRVFVGLGSGALAAVDPAAGNVLGQAKLAGHPESFQLERSGPRAFVNVPNADQIAVVDRTAMKVTASMAGHECEVELPNGTRRGQPSPVRRMPPARQGARVRHDVGKEGGAFDIVGDTDDLWYDAARKRLYMSGGEGFIDVFQQEDGNRFARMAHLATAAGARTSLFAADQNRLYLAVPHRGAQKAEIRIYETR